MLITKLLTRLKAPFYKGYCPNVFGHKMYVSPEDAGVSLGRMNGRNIRDFQGEIGFFHRTVKPLQHVVDLGANVGLFTLLFARSVGPSGTVTSFEPGPLSFSLLSANVRLNGYRNVTIEHAAVTEKSGDLALFVCGSGESDNRIGDESLTGHERMMVRGIALDDYFKTETVDLIKIDIQGAEFMALRGMEKLLTRSRGVQIVMEYAPDFPSSDGPREMLGFIRSLGFSISDLPHQGPARLVTDDDLIATIGGANKRKMTNLILRR